MVWTACLVTSEPTSATIPAISWPGKGVDLRAPSRSSPPALQGHHRGTGRVVMAEVDKPIQAPKAGGSVGRLYVGGVECLEERRPTLVP
jgi:hypothetical protein